MRMPISRLRCRTTKDSTPSVPTTDSNTATWNSTVEDIERPNRIRAFQGA
jgi:hypothetical protein